MLAKIEKDGWGKYIAVCHNGFQWSAIELRKPEDAQLLIDLLQEGLRDGIFSRNGDGKEEIHILRQREPEHV